MAFTFPVDTNSKAGAVRQNPVGEGFHLPTVLYGADGVSTSKTKKVTNKYLGSGQGSTVPIVAGAEIVLYNDHEFDKGTGSWGLNLIETNRPSSEILTNLKIKIVMSNTLGGYSPISGNDDVVFHAEMFLSSVDEVNKALMIEKTTGGATNIIIAGKPFNTPLAKYLKVSVINTHVSATQQIKGVALTEFGWF